MMYAEIAVKLLIAIIGLWAMTKLLGKKEISQLTAFDFVSSLMLSELVGNTIYDRDVHIGLLVFALLFWTALSYGFEKLGMRFPWLSKRMNGGPDLVVRNGRVDVRALRRNNLDLGQLQALLRMQGVFSFADVAFAAFETDGSLSVMRKTDGTDTLPVLVVNSGRLDYDALRMLGRDAAWLEAELSEQGIADPSLVVLAEWTEGKGLYVQRKEGKEVVRA